MHQMAFYKGMGFQRALLQLWQSFCEQNLERLKFIQIVEN